MIERELWARVEPVLERALELPSSEREAFLSEACGEDDELRREVDRLLRADDRAADSILDGTAAELASPLLDAPGDRVLGRYELVRLLGRGGMGAVYLARDRTLDRTVALKFLPPRLAAEPEAIRRFHNEARAASALDHPNLATVHDTAQAEDGRPFIVMGYYPGETLRDRIARGPLPVDDALAIADGVAGGLAAAHAAGIVHRDIKPSNILVTTDGGVRILDFGIATVAGQAVTGPSVNPGTVAYMSPEQTRPGPVDHRTDLWSVGVVLYEALTGQRPFAGDDEAAVIAAIRNDEPPPIRELRPDLPEALSGVVTRCLRKTPGERFPDAGSLLASLRDVAAPTRESTAPSRDPPGPKGGLHAASWRRLPLVLTAAAAVGFAYLGYGMVRDRVAPPGHEAIAARADSAGIVRIAVLPFGVLGDTRFAYLEDGLVELFAMQLDGAGPLRSVDPRALLSFLRERGVRATGGLAPADGREVVRRFDAALFLAGTVVEAGGRLRIRATLYDSDGRLQAEATSDTGDEGRLFDLVDQVSRELIGSRYAGPRERLTRLAAATTASVPALKSYLEGERALRDGHYDRALASFQRAVAVDSAFALAWYRLAVAAEWTLRPTIAGAAVERAVTLAGRLPEHDRLLVSGWHAYATGASSEAERIYRRILEDYPEDVEAWLQLGEVLFHYGPLEGRPLARARTSFERVLSIESEHEGALLHLARIAAREGAHAELHGRVDRLLSARSESEIAVEARALRAFATGDTAGVRAVLRELGGLDSDAVFTAIWTVGYTRDPAAVARLARLLTADRRPADVRATGHLVLAAAELARGRWRRARQELGRAAELNPAWALELGSVWVASGIVPDDPVWMPDSLRAALEAWRPARVSPAVGSAAFLSAHDDVHRVLRSYLLALLDPSPVEPESTRVPVDSMPGVAAVGPGEAAGSTAGILATNLARSLQADALARAGRDREALAALESARPHSPYALAVTSPFHAGSRARLLRADLLARLDRPEEALGFYMSLGDGSVYDLPYLAPAHLRAAALLEALGRPEEAAEHDRRFAQLWRDADPDLRRAAKAVRDSAQVRGPI